MSTGDVMSCIGLLSHLVRHLISEKIDHQRQKHHYYNSDVLVIEVVIKNNSESRLHW